MHANQLPSPASPVFHKVGQNLYRLSSSGTYYGLFKRAGKQIRKSLKTTDATIARRRLKELGEKVSRLTQVKGVGNLTFTELAKRWLETVEVNLKPASASRLNVCIHGLEPFFKGLPVRNVTNRHCEEWMTKRGKAIAAQSYKHERRTLIAILDYAMREGLIIENPARIALPTRKIPKPKQVIPTQGQFKLLVQAIRAADPRAVHGGNLVELLAYSGMRLQEATNLLWGDIDWDRGTFTVTGGEMGTKNLQVRVVPLFPAMRELLERIRGGEQPAATDRVISIDGARTVITNSCKRAGLPHFLHHSMRHYFCSNAIEAGVDFKVIAGWLGHSDGGFLVAKTYGHLRDAHSFEMAKRMVFSVGGTSGRESAPHGGEKGPNSGSN